MLAFYEVVGLVNSVSWAHRFLNLEGLSRAPVFWAFISTLDSSPPSPHNRVGNEAKRSSVELRSLAEVFVSGSF